MNASAAALYEKPFAVLNGFSSISDNELDSSDLIVRDGARKLFVWWRDYVAANGRLPSRNSFDILTMLPHAAHMFLAARLPDGSWAYQLQGEEFKRLFNGGFQEKVQSNMSFAAFQKSVPDYLNAVTEGRKCRRSYGMLSGNVRNRNTFESIDCPLSDSTGRVSHVIGIAEFFRNPAA